MTINPKTLAEFNQALSSLSLKPVDKARLDAIMTTEPRERLVKALNQAENDPRALAYLNNHFGGQAQESAPRSQRPAAPQAPVPSQNAQYAQESYQEPEPAQGGNEENEGADEGRVYLKKHVYGGKAALCFEADETRRGIHTMCLDAADATGPKQYNWGNKVRVQLTRDELLVATAVLFGFLPRCEYKNHGEDNSKGFSIEDQGDKLFVKVFAKGHAIKAVPVTPEDAFYVAQIFLGQMKKNAPWLTAGEILMSLQKVVAARKAPRQGR